jgi:hypothetical protein
MLTSIENLRRTFVFDLNIDFRPPMTRMETIKTGGRFDIEDDCSSRPHDLLAQAAPQESVR